MVPRSHINPMCLRGFCCPESADVPIKAGQVSWRHPRKIEGLNEKPACHCPQQAIVPPSPVGDPYRLFQVGQLPGPPQPSCEFVVFEDRQTSESPKGMENRSAAKDPRVTVENPKLPPQPVDQSECCRRQILSVIPNIEVAAHYMWIGHTVSEHAQSTVTNPGISVEKQQNFARCTLGGGVHLTRPACAGINDPGMV